MQRISLLAAEQDLVVNLEKVSNSSEKEGSYRWLIETRRLIVWDDF